MDTYRELNLEFPKDIQSVKESVHRFAKDVLRPAAVVLDRITDPNAKSGPRHRPTRQTM